MKLKFSFDEGSERRTLERDVYEEICRLLIGFLNTFYFMQTDMNSFVMLRVFLETQ